MFNFLVKHYYVNSKNAGWKIPDLFRKYDSFLIVVIFLEILIGYFLNINLLALVNWQNFYELLLLTFAVAPIITLGKIDIAVNNLGLYAAMIMSYFIKDMGHSKLFIFIYVFIVIMMVIFSLWKKPSNSKGYKITPILLTLFFLGASTISVYKITGGNFLISSLNLFSLALVLFTYYLIIYKQKNSFIGSLGIFFILQGVIRIVFEKIALHDDKFSVSSIVIATEPLITPICSLAIFIIILVIFIMIQWRQLITSYKDSDIYAFADALQEKKMIKGIYFFFLRITDNLKYVKALGSNKRTSEYYGIDIKAYTLYAYLVSFSFLFFFAMYVLTENKGISPESFQSHNLMAIALAVMAGTKMEGGVIFLYRIPLVVLMWAILVNLIEGIHLNQTYASNLFTIIIGIVTMVILMTQSDFSKKFVSLIAKDRKKEAQK